MGSENAGLKAALSYPLLDALFNRRSRRIAKGLSEIRAGSLTYVSREKPSAAQPAGRGGAHRGDGGDRGHLSRPAVPGRAAAMPSWGPRT